MSSHSAQRHRVLLLFMAAVKHPIIERDSVNSVSATADVARYPWPGPRMFLQHRCGASAQGSTCPIAHSCDSPQFINSSDNLIRSHHGRMVVGGNLSRPSRRRQTTSTGLSPITMPPSSFIQRPSSTSSLGRTRNLSEFSTNICFCTQSRCKSLFSLPALLH